MQMKNLAPQTLDFTESCTILSMEHRNSRVTKNQKTSMRTIKIKTHKRWSRSKLEGFSFITIPTPIHAPVHGPVTHPITHPITRPTTRPITRPKSHACTNSYAPLTSSPAP